MWAHISWQNVAYIVKNQIFTRTNCEKDVISVKFKIHECANFEQCFRKLKFWLVLILISARSRAGLSDANKT